MLLTGCGGEDTTDTSSAAGERLAASVEQAEPATSAPAETLADATDATEAEATDAEATSDQATSDQATSDQATSDEEPGSGTSRGGTEGLPGWRIESTPMHGATLWAAYIAVGPPGDPALQRALEEVQRLWPGAGLSDSAAIKEPQPRSHEPRPNTPWPCTSPPSSTPPSSAGAGRHPSSEWCR